MAATIPFYGVNAVPTVGALPASVLDGSVYLVLASYSFYVYSATNTSWTQLTSSGVYAAGNTGAALTLNWNNGLNQSCTATANTTFTLSNPVIGATYRIEITQDATGSRTYTWPAAVKWSGGTAPTGSGANKIDIINLFWDGTNYFGSSSLNN